MRYIAYLDVGGHHKPLPGFEHWSVQPVAVAVLTTLSRSTKEGRVILFYCLCASGVAPLLVYQTFFYLINPRYGDAIPVFVPCFLATSRECLAAADSEAL